MNALPPTARRVLREGALCYLSAIGPAGPHVTPVVFVLHAGRVWGTTARSTAKARAWRRDPRAAGLVRAGERAVTFRGPVTAYDLLDPRTWGAAVRGATTLSRAAVGFSLKNAPFFAGYAVDARRVPLSWTPPGRVFFSVDLEAGAVLDLSRGEVMERWGRWGRSVSSGPGFRPARGRLPDTRVPSEVRRAVGRAGDGALGLAGSHGPVVLPVRRVRVPEDGAYYSVLPRRLMALAGVPSGTVGGLVADHASTWRAADMAGTLLRGPMDVYVLDRLKSGREDLLERIRLAGPLPSEAAVVRVRPVEAVWWKGWASGTVKRR